MPTKKWLRPYAKKTEATKEVRSRLSILEEICMLTAPKWNWKDMVRGMTILEACRQVGISDMTFRNWRAEDKKLHDYYEETKRARKEMAHASMREHAMSNVFNALSGQTKLRTKELVDVSLRYLEKTDEWFNQSIKVDVENKTNPILNMTREELTQRIMELSQSLNINNSQNANTIEWTNLPNTSFPTFAQEQVWAWKNENETEGERGWVTSVSEWAEGN